MGWIHWFPSLPPSSIDDPHLSILSSSLQPIINLISPPSSPSFNLKYFQVISSFYTLYTVHLLLLHRPIIDHHHHHHLPHHRPSPSSTIIFLIIPQIQTQISLFLQPPSFPNLSFFTASPLDPTIYSSRRSTLTIWIISTSRGVIYTLPWRSGSVSICTPGGADWFWCWEVAGLVLVIVVVVVVVWRVVWVFWVFWVDDGGLDWFRIWVVGWWLPAGFEFRFGVVVDFDLVHISCSNLKIRH